MTKNLGTKYTLLKKNSLLMIPYSNVTAMVEFLTYLSLWCLSKLQNQFYVLDQLQFNLNSQIYIKKFALSRQKNHEGN